ncbi:MAG: tetratricopeptide repeat protein, partial [Deltaproteobacteria bacterium]|nr:tetratricopeptide repeat protein [Deltaproteobacteria bacterium]
PVEGESSTAARLDRALAANDLRGAREILQAHLGSAGEDPETLRELAIVQWRMGEHEPARATARRAVAATGHDHEVHTHLLRVYQRREMAELSRVTLEAATDRYGRVRGSLWNELGVARRQAGDRSGARVAFENALAAEQPDPSARVNLAQIHLDSGDVARAERVLREVVQRDPRDAAAWQLLGVVLHRRRLPDEAERAWRRAIEADPGNGEAHYNLGQLAIERGRHADALAPLLRASELRSDDHRVWGNLGIALRALRREAEARRAFERVLALRPDDAVARQALRELGGATTPGPRAP